MAAVRVTRLIATALTRRLEDVIRESDVPLKRTRQEVAIGGAFTVPRLLRQLGAPRASGTSRQ
jgi:hypothetical protein